MNTTPTGDATLAAESQTRFLRSVIPTTSNQAGRARFLDAVAGRDQQNSLINELRDLNPASDFEVIAFVCTEVFGMPRQTETVLVFDEELAAINKAGISGQLAID